MLVEKEVAREHPLGVLSYYHDEVLGPLTELLRLRYWPEKREYGLKHIYRDLPPDMVKELEELYAVVRLEELPAACERAAALFDDTLSAVVAVSDRRESSQQRRLRPLRATHSAAFPTRASR